MSDHGNKGHGGHEHGHNSHHGQTTDVKVGPTEIMIWATCIIVLLVLAACVLVIVVPVVKGLQSAKAHAWQHDPPDDPRPCTTGAFSPLVKKIPPEGLREYLCSGWADEALDGNIVITNPAGKRLYDQPGANHNWGYQPSGWYTFESDPGGEARRVNISNVW